MTNIARILQSTRHIMSDIVSSRIKCVLCIIFCNSSHIGSVFKTKCWTNRTRSSNIKINNFKWMIYTLIGTQWIRHTMVLSIWHDKLKRWHLPNSRSNWQFRYHEVVKLTHAIELSPISRWYQHPYSCSIPIILCIPIFGNKQR